MDTCEGLLISIVDTASLATIGMDQIDMLIADLLTGGDANHICGEILRVTSETRAAVQFERGLAEHQLSGGS